MLQLAVTGSCNVGMSWLLGTFQQNSSLIPANSQYGFASRSETSWWQRTEMAPLLTGSFGLWCKVCIHDSSTEIILPHQNPHIFHFRYETMWHHLTETCFLYMPVCHEWYWTKSQTWYTFLQQFEWYWYGSYLVWEHPLPEMLAGVTTLCVCMGRPESSKSVMPVSNFITRL